MVAGDVSEAELKQKAPCGFEVPFKKCHFLKSEHIYSEGPHERLKYKFKQ